MNSERFSSSHFPKYYFDYRRETVILYNLCDRAVQIGESVVRVASALVIPRHIDEMQQPRKTSPKHRYESDWNSEPGGLQRSAITTAPTERPTVQFDIGGNVCLLTSHPRN